MSEAPVDTRKTAPIAAQHVKPSSKSHLISDFQGARDLLRNPAVVAAYLGESNAPA